MVIASRLLRAALLAVLVAVLLPDVARALEAPPDPVADSVRLAEMFAPRIVVREHVEVCGDGEPFQPAPVTAVLGRQDVVLQQPDGSEVRAPTGTDLAAGSAAAHLDIPGDPLNPDCDYDRWSRDVTEAAPPTLYAHVATDPDHPEQLVLQYWFYWIYNDWNNRHEGDWEMIQIVFPAATPAAALTMAPTSVAYAQHEGSETSPWDDPKLIKDGTHPVVYPSQGSHAAYYDQSQWFGKSAAAGFGCDDTSVSPDVHGALWQPEIIVVPDDPSAQDPQFAWLAYQGHWGQQAPSFNNGPTGPTTKEQWTRPITWQAEQGRDGAAAIPPVPGPAVSTFCAVTEQGSILFIEILDRPALTLAIIALVIVGLVLLVRATAWRGADVTRYDQERRSGQILVAAIAIYLRRLPLFAAIGAVFLAGSALAALLTGAVLAARDSGDVTDTHGATDLVSAVVTDLVSLAVRGPILVVVVAASIAVVSGQHREVGLVTALRRAIAPPTTSLLLAGTFLVVALLALSVLLLPVALWLVARWASAGPTAMVERRGFASALRRSAELTHRKRLRTLALTALMLVFVAAPGPLIGALLLLVTSWPFAVINAIVIVSYAVTLPIFGIGLMLQCYDLRQEDVRDDEAAAGLPAVA